MRDNESVCEREMEKINELGLNESETGNNSTVKQRCPYVCVLLSYMCLCVCVHV